MLKEIESVSQSEGTRLRRWFTDDDLDLYVWYEEDGSIIQFQICYDRGENEQALTWSADHGLFQASVDDGEGRIMKMKSTPVLTGQNIPDTERARELMIHRGQKLEHDLFEFIHAALTR